MLVFGFNSIVVVQTGRSTLLTVREINEWTNMEPTVIPGSRLDSDFAYDIKTDKLILFSGLKLPGFYTDTWVYDYNSNTWTNMSPPTMPQGRNAHLMAYDEESDRTILFSGSETGPWTWTCWNDTWVYNYNDNTWTNMSPATQPIGRTWAGMVYDKGSDRIILFGGFSRDIIYADTWAYDFNSNEWINMTPLVQPSPRWGHKMIYDEESDRVILFGGSVVLPAPPVAVRDTWTYDYDTNTWVNVTPSISPPALLNYGLAYDSKSNRTILYGGANSSLINQGETWVYNSNTNIWMNETVSTSLGPRRRFAMTYDKQSDRTILFGGFHAGMPLNETWSLNYQLAEETTTTTTTTSTTTTTTTTSTTTTTTPDSTPSFTLLIIATGFIAISILRKRWRESFRK